MVNPPIKYITRDRQSDTPHHDDDEYDDDESDDDDDNDGDDENQNLSEPSLSSVMILLPMIMSCTVLLVLHTQCAGGGAPSSHLSKALLLFVPPVRFLQMPTPASSQPQPPYSP